MISGPKGPLEMACGIQDEPLLAAAILDADEQEEGGEAAYVQHHQQIGPVADIHDTPVRQDVSPHLGRRESGGGGGR